MLNKVHHVAVICSNYEVSKQFYTQVLGLEILNETYRESRQSYKLDLALNGVYVLELFSFPNSPKRLTQPESVGLRHLAFEVNNVEQIEQKMKALHVPIEPIRVDEFSNKKFTFITDPDGLPIEFYEK
jgi:glyoxylase I family protein